MQTGQLMRGCQQPRKASTASPARLVATSPNGPNHLILPHFEVSSTDFIRFSSSDIANSHLAF